MQIRQLNYQLIFSLLIALLLTSCDDSTQTDIPSSHPKVTTLTLKPKEFSIMEELSGRVVPVKTAEIRAQIGGIIQQRNFEQGTEIEEGTTLFQIDSAPFQIEVESAEASLKKAQAILETTQKQTKRLESLLKMSVISQQAYDEGISSYKQAIAEVAQAESVLARRKLDMHYSSVKAPISGRVDQALVTEGALVSSTDSTPLAIIQQIDQVYIDARQSVSLLNTLRNTLTENLEYRDSGIPVQILDDNNNLTDMHGYILFSGINVDSGTGDVLIRILVNNPQRKLLPGMYVRTRVLQTHYKQALTIPEQAVIHTGNDTRVWVVDSQNKVDLVNVKLGELYDQQYRVISGLGAEQKVVIEGIERLSIGLQVETHQWQSEKNKFAQNSINN